MKCRNCGKAIGQVWKPPTGIVVHDEHGLPRCYPLSSRNRQIAKPDAVIVWDETRREGRIRRALRLLPWTGWL